MVTIGYHWWFYHEPWLRGWGYHHGFSAPGRQLIRNIWFQRPVSLGEWQAMAGPMAGDGRQHESMVCYVYSIGWLILTIYSCVCFTIGWLMATPILSDCLQALSSGRQQPVKAQAKARPMMVNTGWFDGSRSGPDKGDQGISAFTKTSS